MLQNATAGVKGKLGGNWPTDFGSDPSPGAATYESSGRKSGVSQLKKEQSPVGTTEKLPDTIVRGAHASNIAKRGAAQIVVVQRWATPYV